MGGCSEAQPTMNAKRALHLHKGDYHPSFDESTRRHDLNVAFIVCIFSVLIFRPDRVANPSKFRLAIILFAIALVIPSLGMILLHITNNTPRMPGMKKIQGINGVELFMSFTNLASILFFCGAFMSATSSLMPHPENE